MHLDGNEDLVFWLGKYFCCDIDEKLISMLIHECLECGPSDLFFCCEFHLISFRLVAVLHLQDNSSSAINVKLKEQENQEYVEKDTK